MCFTALGVMFYLVGSDSKKRKGRKKSGSDRSQRRVEERVKLNCLGVKPSFPSHAWKAISEAAESLTTH